jgi:hypothetical protein
MTTKKRRIQSVSGRTTAPNGNGVAAAPGRPYESAIRRRLASVRAVDAVYVSQEEDGRVHVYSVVSEYADEAYHKLLKQERLIEEAFPEVPLEFHVRAHQGREPSRAVPFGSQPLFVR